MSYNKPVHTYMHTPPTSCMRDSTNHITLLRTTLLPHTLLRSTTPALTNKVLLPAVLPTTTTVAKVKEATIRPRTTVPRRVMATDPHRHSSSPCTTRRKGTRRSRGITKMIGVGVVPLVEASVLVFWQQWRAAVAWI